MSFELIRACYEAGPILKKRGLNGTERSVLTALANRANPVTFRCDPGTKCISKDTGWDEKTVDRAVRSLAQAGVLSYVPRGGNFNANDYTIFHEAHPDKPKRRVLTPKEGLKVSRVQKKYKKGGDFKSQGQKVPGTLSPKAGDVKSEDRDFVSEGGDFKSEGGDLKSHKPDNQLKQYETGLTNLLSEPVGEHVSSASPVSGLPGTRPGTITNPMELRSRQQAKTKAPVATPATPTGPMHPLSMKFLENVGATDALKRKGQAWDHIAAELEQTYPLADLLAVVDWVWADDNTNPFWADQFAKSYEDPFKFFATKAEKILDVHQRLLVSRAREAKRNSNKENSNDINDDLADFNPISD